VLFHGTTPIHWTRLIMAQFSKDTRHAKGTQRKNKMCIRFNSRKPCVINNQTPTPARANQGSVERKSNNFCHIESFLLGNRLSPSAKPIILLTTFLAGLQIGDNWTNVRNKPWQIKEIWNPSRRRGSMVITTPASIKRGNAREYLWVRRINAWRLSNSDISGSLFIII
jgi:hypothetical protein